MPELGLLFDLDGTMVDSDHHHFAAFNALLGEFGRSVTREHFNARIMGGANAEIMRELFPDLDAARQAELADRKEAMFRDMSPRMDPIPGLPALLDWAHARGVPVGAVTNAPRLNAEHMLTALGFDHLIPSVVIGEELPRSKPDPLPYLTGAERLGLAPERIVAFEDSRSGIKAATGAGMRTVGIATGLPPELLETLGTTLVIHRYDDPRLRALLEGEWKGRPGLCPGPAKGPRPLDPLS